MGPYHGADDSSFPLRSAGIVNFFFQHAWCQPHLSVLSQSCQEEYNKLCLVSRRYFCGNVCSAIFPSHGYFLHWADPRLYCSHFYQGAQRYRNQQGDNSWNGIFSDGLLASFRCWKLRQYALQLCDMDSPSWSASGCSRNCQGHYPSV